MSILTLPLPRPSGDTRAFAEATENLTGAVALVAWGGDHPRGLLVHTVSALSAKPPRILFAVDKADGEHDGLLLEQECSVNLLKADDQAEAERFLYPDDRHARFTSERWHLRIDAPPELIGSLAHFSGFIDQKIDAGSHSLFIVRVNRAAVRPSAPLVYFDHAFRRLQTPTAAAPE